VSSVRVRSLRLVLGSVYRAAGDSERGGPLTGFRAAATAPGKWDYAALHDLGSGMPWVAGAPKASSHDAPERPATAWAANRRFTEELEAPSRIELEYTDLQSVA